MVPCDECSGETTGSPRSRFFPGNLPPTVRPPCLRRHRDGEPTSNPRWRGRERAGSGGRGQDADATRGRGEGRPRGCKAGLVRGCGRQHRGGLARASGRGGCKAGGPRAAATAAKGASYATAQLGSPPGPCAKAQLGRYVARRQTAPRLRQGSVQAVGPGTPEQLLGPATGTRGQHGGALYWIGPAANRAATGTAPWASAGKSNKKDPAAICAHGRGTRHRRTSPGQHPRWRGPFTPVGRGRHQSATTQEAPAAIPVGRGHRHHQNKIHPQARRAHQ